MVVQVALLMLLDTNGNVPTLFIMITLINYEL